MTDYETLLEHVLMFGAIKFNRKPPSIFDYREEDIELINYQHHPAIKAELAV